MQKYFITPENLKNNIITGDDCHHISVVMRFRIDDKVLEIGRASCRERV